MINSEKISGAYKTLNEFTKLEKVIVQEQDMDFLCAVSGFKGLGKTTFSVQAARRYLENFCNTKFNLTANMAYDNDEVMQKTLDLKEYHTLVCDEAVRFAMAEDWMQSESKDLKRMFAQIRTKHLVYFFNIPEFWWLDKKYREDMTTCWVHIIKRGIAAVFFPDLTPGVIDRWHRKELLTIFEKRPLSFFTINIEHVVRSLHQHPCFWDVIAYPQLPQDMYASYLELRNKKVRESIKSESRSDRWKVRALAKNLYLNRDKIVKDIQKLKGELSQEKIVNTFFVDEDGEPFISPQQFSVYVKED